MQHCNGLESEKWLCNVMNDTARKALIGEQTEETGRGKGGEGGGGEEEQNGEETGKGREDGGLEEGLQPKLSGGMRREQNLLSMSHASRQVGGILSAA